MLIHLKAESKVLLIDRIQEEAEAHWLLQACWTFFFHFFSEAERLAEEMDDRSDIELLDDDDEKNEAEEFAPEMSA